MKRERAIVMLRVEPALKRKLEAAARADRRSVNVYTTMVLERHLAERRG